MDRFPKKFNILYLHQASVFGGAENSILELVKHLNRDKFRPIVVCPGEGVFSNKLNEAGIETKSLSIKKLINIFLLFKGIIKLIQLIKQEDICLIHSQTPRTNLLGAVAAKFTGIPAVWHARNLLERGMFDVDRLFLELTDRLICNSESIRARFAKKDKVSGKILTIHNGVDLERFNLSIKGDKIRKEFDIRKIWPLIGIVGRLDPRKGHRYFIKAAKEISKVYPEARYLVVGEALFPKNRRYKNGLKNLIKDLGLSKKVIFTGFRNDIPRIISALDIVVMASDAEPFGRVMIEAMAMAKPLVATNSGAGPEIVIDGETGILVSPKDSTSLAKAVMALVEDKERASQLAKAGRRRVEKLFSIERNVSKTEEVYLDLLKGKQLK